MKNLGLNFKFLIIIGLLSLPTAVATHLLSTETTHSINLTRKEVEGTRQLQPLVQLQQAIGRHRLAVFSSLATEQRLMAKSHEEVALALASLNAVNKRHPISTTLDADLASLTQAINEMLVIESKPRLEFEEREKVHQGAGESLANYLKALGDNSNLITDPQIDTYHLMDFAILKFPEVIDQLDNYRATFSEKTGYTFFQSHRFLLNRLESKGQAAVAAIHAAIANNPDLANALETRSANFESNYLKAIAAADFALLNPRAESQQTAYDLLSESIAEGYRLQASVGSELHKLLQARVARDVNARWLMLSIIMIAVALGLLLTYFVSSSITKAIRQASNIATAIANDHLNNTINSTGTDESGQLLRSLAEMQEKLRTRIHAERELSNENGRIKQAIECVSSVVLVADVDGVITYCNRAGSDYFRQHRAEFSSAIPALAADSTIGLHEEIFCIDPNANSNVKDQLRDQSTETIVERLIGKRTVRVVSSPVNDEEGIFMGSVIEISDLTDEVAVQLAISEDVHGLVKAALLGNLSQRIKSQDKPDFVIPVYDGINNLLDICSTVIDSAGQLFKRMAEGDFSRNMEVDSSFILEGEFKRLQHDANTTVTQLSSIISRVKQDAQVVSNSANKVISVNTQLEDNAMLTGHKASRVSGSISTIAENVESVASAAVEMNTSIREIATYTQKSADVAREAVCLTQAADSKVSQLSTSTEAIGAMVKVINSIAEQTNLLALNATIEAARAGEAGKGFAVVANEVKELAKETAKATEDISEKIRTIQADSDSAAEGIRAIDDIVQQINDLLTSTASAMAQQSATTQDISQSISSVSNGSSSISTELDELVSGASDNTEAVNVVKLEVMGLNEVALGLQRLADKFIVSNATQLQATDSERKNTRNTLKAA